MRLGLFLEILAGQEEKQKTYGCMVWVSRAVSKEQVAAALDSVSNLSVAQDTPIRVVHRRAPLVRMKTIISMQSRWVNQHWFELTIVASAGTYIKEFVHGDLGRTEPSVGSLLGCAADIFQLDVLEVHTHGRLDLDLVVD